MAQEWFDNLADQVVDVLGETVTVTRTSGGTYSPSARAYVGGSTVGPVTLTADVQKTRRVTRSVGSMGGDAADLDEIVMNFNRDGVAATALGDLREGDVVACRGRSRPIVSVEYEAMSAIIRVVVRSEKRQKPTS